MATWIITGAGQQCDDSGDPLSGAKIYVYDAGTTTSKNVYSDPDLDVSHIAANPIVTDSAGRHAMRYIETGPYKLVIKTSADVTVATLDNVDGGIPVGSGALAIANGGTGATSAAAALAALGAATSEEVADVSAEVASLAGQLGSSEKSHIATGTTAQRPGAPVEGDIRRNTDNDRWEGYNQVPGWEQFLTDTEIASQAEAVALTNNTKVMTPLRAKQGNPFCSGYAYFQDERAAGTDGGTFTSGAWRTRTLANPLAGAINNISGCSILTNQITLPAGSYYVRASAPGLDVGGHICRLQNITDASTITVGTSDRCGNASGVQIRSSLEAWFTIGGSKVVELQHICQTTSATTGFGRALSLGVSEIYSWIAIWKIA